MDSPRGADPRSSRMCQGCGSFASADSEFCRSCGALIDVGSTRIEVRGTSADEVLNVARSLAADAAGRLGDKAPRRLERKIEETVFVSYAREDQSFVERLVSDLAQEGVHVWWDQSLQPGADWGSAVANALTMSAAVLYVSSAASSHSDWVRHEVEVSADRGRLILPIIIDDAGAANLPLALKNLQRTDFRHDYPDALDKLLKILPKPLIEHRPVPPPPVLSKGYVFLSYAEEDSSFVDESLKPLLKTQRFTFWEYRGTDREYKLSIARELEDRITNAAALVAVLSPNWKSSEWTERELLYAEAIDRPRFLVLAQPMVPSILTIGKLVFDFTVSPRAAGQGLLDELAKEGL